MNMNMIMAAAAVDPGKVIAIIVVAIVVLIIF